MTRTLLLVDGEHYPPVIEAVLPKLRQDGANLLAAVFLGGFEKTGSPPELPLPVHTGDPFSLVPRLVRELRIELVLDLSDEPVLDARSRFVLAGLSLAEGAAYGGGGFRFEAPPRPNLTDLPTVAIIGTGKRTGKTALSIELARHWKSEDRRPCIVTMGRGGPPDPLVLRGEVASDPFRLIQELGGAGLHATSDYVEDAVFAGVDTVGTRRLGAGPGGSTVDDTFAEGVSAAVALDPGMLIYEGSGTAIPPAHADATVLVARADLDPEFLVGYLGSYRLAVATALVVMGDGGDRLAREARRLVPDLEFISAELAPRPDRSIAGRSVVLATTAPPSAAEEIQAELRRLGASSVRVVPSLSDRRRLAGDLAELRADDLVLTEIKAAAAAVVMPAAARAGAEVGFVHNTVRMENGCVYLADLIERSWPVSVRP